MCSAARALGVWLTWKIMFRHLLPNAMVATVTMMPFVRDGRNQRAGVARLPWVRSAILGSPSLGELALQAKQNNLQAPWLGLHRIPCALAIMLSLLVFVFEGVRDAFDPRKDVQMMRSDTPLLTIDKLNVGFRQHGPVSHLRCAM